MVNYDFVPQSPPSFRHKVMMSSNEVILVQFSSLERKRHLQLVGSLILAHLRAVI